MLKIILLFILSTSVTFALNVKGEFKGWGEHTIVKLDDGSEWQQDEYYYYYCYCYSPKVKLFQEGGRTKMLVEDCVDRAVFVKEISGNHYNSHEANAKRTLEVRSDYEAKLEKLKQYLPEGQTPGMHGGIVTPGGLVTLSTPIIGSDASEDTHNTQSNSLSYAQPTSQLSNTYIKVNNNSNYETYFCYGYYTESIGWVSKGWYKIEAKKTINIDLGIYQGNTYLYAEAQSGAYIWTDVNSKYSFCVSKFEAFNIPNTFTCNCPESSHKRVKVFELKVAPGENVWNIN